jgi:hypothetical protein
MKFIYSLTLVLCPIFLFGRPQLEYTEFNPSITQLGEYISIKDHPKAKGVNLKLKVPLGWKVEEGDRPNVVKKFVNNGNVYLILIKDNATFFTRKQIRNSFIKENLADELIKELVSSLKQPKIISKVVITVDNYPTLQFTFTCNVERMGFIIPVRMKCWAIMYEDKFIYLQSSSFNNAKFDELEQLYSSITNSLVFPEQYN